MRRLLDITRYHWAIVFALAGIFAGSFAFATYNLFHYSMANLSFLRKYGLIAVQEGALIQTLEIAIGGAFALACFLGFKICESDLMQRFRSWTARRE